MEFNLQDVDAIIDQWGPTPASLLQIMLDINHRYNYLPKESIDRVAKRLRMPVSQVFGVANFFKVFSLTPRGRVIMHVCTGTACHVKGGPKIIERLVQEVNLHPGETSEDLFMTLETVNCVGACASAPVVVVGDATYSEVTPNKVSALVKGLKEQEAQRS
ncbi:MAG: NAD(P)H-dependent oxidoreductase subunit E [Desulforhabdus sp.]|jgi:NADH-quinone oxidoreductase subunit E|nr:NAD(P)H-dependent oxidoreductase subunit E [Desulforhabdus sp.]